MNDMSGEYETAPHSIEAEQQLLGALLLNNDLYEKISGFTKPEHFFEPVHADMFRNIAGRIAKDHLASPVTLKADFEMHEGLKELGGSKYLVNLAGASVSSFAIADYARQVEEAWQRRCILNALEEALAVVRGNPDPEVARGALEAAVLTLPETEGRESFLSLMKSMRNTIEEMNEAYQGDLVGVPTGLKAIDDRHGGLQRQDLILLAGRPSMGKTALGLSFATHAAKAGKKVAIVSLEMSDRQLTNRILSEVSRIDYARARRGAIEENEFRKIVDVAKEVQELPLYIVPPHVRDVPGIHAALKSISKRAGGLDLVLIDYLQLIRSKGNSANERVSETSAQLKQLARLFDVPVIAISQLSRQCETRDNKRPIMSDLRDSGSLEQDADAILFCYRHEYYMARETAPKEEGKRADWEADFTACKNKMEVITAKQRMGDIGVDLIGCHMPTNRFWGLEKADENTEEMAF